MSNSMGKIALFGLEKIEVTTTRGEFFKGEMVDILAVTFDGDDSLISFSLKTGPHSPVYAYITARVRDIKVIQGLRFARDC